MQTNTRIDRNNMDQVRERILWLNHWLHKNKNRSSGCGNYLTLWDEREELIHLLHQESLSEPIK